jgi:hypothetical protein
MRLLLTCKETTRLVLEGEDRALSLGQRLLVRTHQSMCKGCTRFARQVVLMRGAMQNWRSYSETEDSRNSTGTE